MDPSIAAAATAEQLCRYAGNWLERGVVDEVAERAGQLACCSVREVLAGVPIREVRLSHRPDSAPTLLLEVPADDPLEARSATVVCFQMGTGDDPVSRMLLTQLSQHRPGQRIVALCQPCGDSHGSDLPERSLRRQVATGDHRPRLEPLLRYLRDTGVKSTQIIGASYGAELAVALTAMAHEPPYGIEVKCLLAVEPPRRGRRLVPLALRFLTTIGGIAQHQGEVAVPAYHEAWRTVPMMRYIGGLLTRPNIAIAQSIAASIRAGTFWKNLDAALKVHPGLQAVVAAGTRSELLDPEDVHRHGSQLAAKHDGRLEVVGLGPHRHALCRNLFLMIALVLQHERNAQCV